MVTVPVTMCCAKAVVRKCATEPCGAFRVPVQTISPPRDQHVRLSIYAFLMVTWTPYRLGSSGLVKVSLPSAFATTVWVGAPVMSKCTAYA